MPDDRYAKYDHFEGPTPHQVWEAHRRNRGVPIADCGQGSGGLRQMSPRFSKYKHQQIAGVRVK